jgi:hypothetical protein
MAGKDATQLVIEKLEAEIADRQRMIALLRDTQKTQPKRKARTKAPAATE